MHYVITPSDAADLSADDIVINTKQIVVCACVSRCRFAHDETLRELITRFCRRLFGVWQVIYGVCSSLASLFESVFHLVIISVCSETCFDHDDYHFRTCFLCKNAILSAATLTDLDDYVKTRPSALAGVSGRQLTSYFRMVPIEVISRARLTTDAWQT